MVTKAESLKQSFSIGSQGQEYETPDSLFNLLNDEFHFDVDICASKENNKLDRYYTKLDDCFTKDWSETSWINPEFMVVKKFIKKAFEDSTKFGSTIVILALSKTNTNWWRDYVMNAKEVRFINQKLQFKNTKQGLRFPASIIIFQPHEGITKFSVIDIPAERFKHGQKIHVRFDEMTLDEKTELLIKAGGYEIVEAQQIIECSFFKDLFQQDQDTIARFLKENIKLQSSRHNAKSVTKK